jgi:hypothetical protein
LAAGFAAGVAALGVEVPVEGLLSVGLEGGVAVGLADGCTALGSGLADAGGWLSRGLASGDVAFGAGVSVAGLAEFDGVALGGWLSEGFTGDLSTVAGFVLGCLSSVGVGATLGAAESEAVGFAGVAVGDGTGVGAGVAAGVEGVLESLAFGTSGRGVSLRLLEGSGSGCAQLGSSPMVPKLIVVIDHRNREILRSRRVRFDFIHTTLNRFYPTVRSLLCPHPIHFPHI